MPIPMIDTLFLDRDGTVMEDRHYLRDPDLVTLLPGVGETLARVTRAGIRLFLVTNQSGIARGYLTEADFYACQSRLEELLAAYGVRITDARFCPHVPDDSEDGCECRKPRTGMWESLRQAHRLDPRRCVMVGDKPEDVLFGVNAGFAASFRVLTGKSAGLAQEDAVEFLPDMSGPFTSSFSARTLDDVADVILGG